MTNIGARRSPLVSEMINKTVPAAYSMDKSTGKDMSGLEAKKNLVKLCFSSVKKSFEFESKTCPSRELSSLTTCSLSNQTPYGDEDDTQSVSSKSSSSEAPIELMAVLAKETPYQSQDPADYLRVELQARIQQDPDIFGWIQSVALQGLWYWDLETPEIEWMSPDLKALFGYQDEEVPNVSSWWQENMFPEDLERVREAFTDHVENGGPYNEIVRYHHKDGSTVWVCCRGKVFFDKNNKPIRMMGVHSDLTSLMKTQEELRKKESVLDLLCTTALDGYWDWNIKTGENLLSARWKKALGYQEHELSNRVETWTSLLHPDDLTKALNAIQAHMDEGAQFGEVLRYKRKDGTWAHMLAQGIAQKDEKGEWARMFGTHTDVSYLEEARAAREANAAKSTFLATMSHEIRTPLNAVLGMTQMLQCTQLSEEQQDCVTTLFNSGAHLLSLINDILDFSQIEAGLIRIDTVEVQVQETVRGILQLMLLEATKKNVNLTFSSKIPPDSKFRGDPERMRQIVFNLVGNALKFTDAGTVGIQLELEERIGLMGVSIKVHDTGCGMTPEQQERIFDDFTQADETIRRKYGGSGLGLSISKKLCNALGGTLKVEQSNVGEGSTFALWLPGIYDYADCTPTTACNQKVVLFQKEEFAQGSVIDGLETIGCNVCRVSDISELRTAFETVKPEVVVLERFDSADRSSEVANFLNESVLQDSSTIILDVGKGFSRSVEEQYKHRCRTLPLFSSTSELRDAFATSFEPKPACAYQSDTKLTEKHLQILIVEDNLINQKVMRKLLSRFNCSTEMANNGEEAIAMAKEKKWDLIFMDCVMPVMDGLESTREIRKFDKSTPIVALTANATTEDRDLCLSSGMDEFLSKPVGLNGLGKMICRFCSCEDESMEEQEELKSDEVSNDKDPC